MPWSKIDDRLPMSVKIEGLADDDARGSRYHQQRNEALGHWLLILAWVSSERSDGFVTARRVQEYGRPATTARLVRARFGRAPLLHRHGDECVCLEGRPWPPDYEYAIHDYLDRNPGRSENDVQRAKRRELRNSDLKRAVRDRDRDRCRYCGKHCVFSDRISDDGLTFDHVNPKEAHGIDNLVVACRGCNNHKNNRTPQAADMVLLPPPSDGDRIQPIDGDDSTYLRPTYDGHRSVVGPVVGRSQVSSQVDDPPHNPDQGTDLPPDLQRSPHTSQRQTSPGRDGEGPGVAPAAASPVRSRVETVRKIGPPDTLRGSRSESPYDRPRHHAGIPADPSRRSRASPVEPPPVVWPEDWTRERPRSSNDEGGPAP